MTEFERRRELLRQAREKAQARADSSYTPVAEPDAAADAKPEAPKLETKSALKQYEEASKTQKVQPPAEPKVETPRPAYTFKTEAPKSEAPKPAVVEAPKPQLPKFEAPKPKLEAAKEAVKGAVKDAAPETPWWQSLSDSANDTVKTNAVKTEAPKPAAPVKAEVKKVVEAPKKVVEAPKAAVKVVEEKNKKRKGPLPLFLAQLLVLGGYVGVGLAATKYSEESGALLKSAGEKVSEIYKQIDKRAAQ